ncbi:hypothetical protein B0O99DRAFT_696387 [Bisporella sp. PMI_857]|nr:hypothetical protein B0O99DRAFT_696387 [Bisporella sp. PMI_857]
MSCLSPPTPLHITVGKGDISMAKCLAGEGFSVNIFPLASVKCCLNPIMATIVITPDKMSAYQALAPFADHTIRSKMFNIRILHLAIAKHDLRLIQRVEANSPLSSAGTTTFNHTLLHIACLPSN